MTQKSSTYRSEPRDARNELDARDALAQTAIDATPRAGLLEANAYRALSLEGSSAEERLRARASLVSCGKDALDEIVPSEPAPSPRYELVEPGVISLPDFDGSVSATLQPSSLASAYPVNVSLSSEERGELETPEENHEIDESTLEQESESDSLETPSFDFQDGAPEATVSFDDLKRRPGFYMALVETVLCLPCGLLALLFLWRAAFETEREDYNAAARYDAKAQTALYVGKALFVLAFFSASAALIVSLLGD